MNIALILVGFAAILSVMAVLIFAVIDGREKETSRLRLPITVMIYCQI